MTLQVLPANPRANYLAHKIEIDQAISGVLDGGHYVLGKEVATFEQEFATYLGARNAIGVGSGTEALNLALRACGVGSGDAVFTVSHTAVATVAAIELAGARPVLVDIDPVTFTMDPDQLEAAVKAPSSSMAGCPKAVIPVHLYGHPADMQSILDIARRHGLYVVEDCAQSHGATIRAQRTGTWGDLAAFSFYPTKNLGALGDGGAVVTDDANLAEQVRLLRQYGWRQRYVSEIAGANSRLDELQAAILRIKLPYLDRENHLRRELAQLYTNLLNDAGLALPAHQGESEHVYHQYVVRASKRDGLQSYLRQRSIGTLIHYPQPVHLQPAYAGRMMINNVLPHSERAATQVLSLPMYPELTHEQVEFVAQAVHDWNENS